MRKIINKINHELLRFYVKIKKFKYGVNKEYRDKKIIVSLTSFPARFKDIDLCIKSLLLQTVKPDKIIIYLGSDSSAEEIDKYLCKFEKYGVTFIKDEKRNIKSHKKYFYALSDFSNDIVIVVDDDLIYPPNMIQSLIEKHNLYPNCIVGRRVHKMIVENCKIKNYQDWDGECENILIPSHKLFVTTGAGTLFPPNMIKGDLLNLDFIEKYAFTADDVWINFMSIKNDVKRVWAENKLQMPTTIKQSQKFSLVKLNVEENRNDNYIKNIIQDFNINLNDIFESEENE